MIGKTNTIYPGYGDLEVLTKSIQGTIFVPGVWKIAVKGGSRKGYKFKLKAYDIPKSLTLSEDGTVSGIPLSGGTMNRDIIVTDSEGNTAKGRVRFACTRYKLRWQVTNSVYYYDGQPHSVTLTPLDIPDVPGMPEEAKTLVQGVDYFPYHYTGSTYEKTITNSITSIVEVRMSEEMAKFYSTRDTVGHIQIRVAEDFTFKLKSKTVQYDGQPHEIIPEIVNNAVPGEDIQYKVTYKGRSGTVYTETETPPTNVGTYTVTALVTARNYKKKETSAILTITA